MEWHWLTKEEQKEPEPKNYDELLAKEKKRMKFVRHKYTHINLTEDFYKKRMTEQAQIENKLLRRRYYCDTKEILKTVYYCDINHVKNGIEFFNKNRGGYDEKRK